MWHYQFSSVPCSLCVSPPCRSCNPLFVGPILWRSLRRHSGVPARLDVVRVYRTTCTPASRVRTTPNSGAGAPAAPPDRRAAHPGCVSCEAARRGILASVGGTLPAPRCEVLPLDLSDLGSVRTFADECRRRHAGNISVVVAVAAEIVYEEGRQAASGADLSFATNQLGLQALLAELEPELLSLIHI